MITFAGINSSQANQNAGKNDHFRSFEIKYPPRKKQKTDEEKGHVNSLGRNSLFKPTPSAKSETYQRLLRLSPAQKRAGGSRRIGAIATGLAKKSELVVFNATTSTPGSEDIITRIEPDGGAEVADLDVATAGTDEFSVAYCTDYNIYEQTYQYDFSKKQVQKMPNVPRRIHQMPFLDATENPASRPKFRALRFLDSQNVVALLNKPGRTGSELRIYHLYPTGPAIMTLQMSLPSHIKQAVSLDVCALDTDKKGNRQSVVAVAGQDISIEIYTINYTRNTDTYSRFRSYQSSKNVHPQQMTKLCLSPFHSPARAQDPDSQPSTDEKKPKAPMHPGPQYIRLASVSYGNTVVVDTLPLSPLDPKDKDSRYVLSHPDDERFQRIAYTYFAFLIPLLMAYLVHFFMYPEVTVATRLINVLPEPVRHRFGTPAPLPVAQSFGSAVHSTASSIVASDVPTAIPGQQRLADLLSVPGAEQNALVVRHDPANTGVAVDVHPDKQALLAEHAEAKHWHELSDEHKAEWKRRLKAAGFWVESEGERVLKGVMFSTYAGLVGQAAGEILREL